MALGKINSLISRYLNSSNQEVKKSEEKLSSGSKLNKASDDAAGVAIAAKLESEAATLEVANRNIGSGNSAADIADSALSEISDMTTRMAELATQSANGTYSDEQRSQMKAEYDALAQEAQRVAQTTEYNGSKVFDEKGVTIQVGNDGSSRSQVEVSRLDLSKKLEDLSKRDIGTQEGGVNALDAAASTTGEITALRAQLGATVSRLNTATSNNTTSEVESSSAQSEIRDVKVAEESARNVAANIRRDSSAAIMAQSNQSAHIVQALLG